MLSSSLEQAKKRIEKKEKELAVSNPKLHALVQRFMVLAQDGQSKANELSKNVTDRSVASVLRLRRLQARREAHKLHKGAGAGGGAGSVLGLGLRKFNSSGSESAPGTPKSSSHHHHHHATNSSPSHTHANTSSLSNLSSDLLQIEGGDVGDLTTHERKPLRAESLLKQAQKEFSVWRARYVVLYGEGICYWDDEATFAAHRAPPRGKLLFCDFVTLSGRAADSAPRFMFMMLGKNFVFVIHKEDATFVFCCPNKDSLHGWVAAINTAYKEFVALQTRKAALMDAVWIVGSTEVWAVAEKLSQTSTSIDMVLGELNLMLHNQYEEDVVALREHYVFRRCFHIWMAYARARRMKRVEAVFFST